MPEPRISLRVLIVEDSADDAELLVRAVRQSGYEPAFDRVESAAAMRAALHEKPWDLILSDYMIPGFGAMEALRIAKESDLDLPFIVISGKVGEEALVEVMKAGASDFLLKGYLGRLGSVIKRELADAAARRAMRQARIEWRAAFDAVRDPIFIHDADFRILRANLAYAALAGVPITQVIGKRYWEVFPVQDGPLPGCRAITEGLQGWKEEEFALTTGEAYASRSFAVTNDRGEYLYSFHVLQDVTERNRIRDAVQTSERRFRSLIESSADAFFVIDPAGKIIYRSESGANLTGYKADDLLEHEIMQFLAPEDIPIAQRALGEVLRAPGKILSAELRLRRVDGAVIDAEFVAKNCLDIPEVCGIVITARDITVRKKADRELKLFRALIDQSSDAIEVSDPTTLQLLDVNDRACQDLGYSRQELLAMTVRDIDPTLDRSVEDKVKEQLRTAGFARLNTVHRRKDDSTFPVEVNVRHVELDRSYRVASVRDVSERQRAEEATRQLAERLTTTLESITDAFFTVDQAWRFTFLNREAERLLARTREELIGQDLWVEFPSAVGSMFDREYHRAIEDQQSVEFEQFYAPLGTWFSVRAYPSKQGLAVYFRDIGERKLAEEAVRERIRLQDQLVRIAASVPGLIYSLQLRPDGSIALPYVSGALKEIFDLEPADVIEDATPVFSMIHPDDIGHVNEVIAETARTLAPSRIEFRVRRTERGEVWVEAHSLPQREADGSVVWHGFIQDITERKKTEARIAYLNRVYAMLSGVNTLIVRARDREELFQEACRIAVEAGGFRMAWLGVLDLRVMKIMPAASAGMNDELLAALAERYSVNELGSPGIPLTTRAMTKKTVVVVSDLERDSTVVFRERLVAAEIGSMAILPLVVSDQAVGILTLYAGESEFFREEELKLLSELAGDIAFAIEHIGRQERLDFMAYYDELTGLANRNLFLDRVTQYLHSAASGGHHVAVFLIDLERFKNINDSLGRPAGDALLRQVAEWLTSRAGDANLLAHIGADHFAAVLPEEKQGGNLGRLLETWMEALVNHPFRLNDAEFRVTFKIGVARFPDDGADAETLFRNAEAALKKAKAGGERYLFYAQQMTELVAGKVALENQLRQALDNGEFVLHYQPKVNLASGKVTSAEALIRWNDPRTGLVPPGRFIPILEETGLIYEVGRWALNQAIADYLRWRAAGLPAVRIAVNVSALQLRRREFIAEIEQAIGIDANAAAGLELEITESLIMEDIKQNIVRLQAIRGLDISIAIDDFGTGFSSLSYLAKLPVDTLKIDRSFVIDMTAGPQGLALVSTIIDLAHSLKLKVVAEGVETEEQSRLLRLLDCDEMQGFLFSKPVPAEIFETRFLALPPAAAN
ncbi:MAG: EAL domain-containing protein [Sulfuritalea sp.]|jgi:diguanylate cyclase (GGDEF)-like protein/PAS domain S-box-containing protein|nr:EAL domain-containing protein [Sulfuritalea sp.]